jgi:hypothetical protein
MASVEPIPLNSLHHGATGPMRRVSSISTISSGSTNASALEAGGRRRGSPSIGSRREILQEGHRNDERNKSRVLVTTFKGRHIRMMAFGIYYKIIGLRF